MNRREHSAGSRGTNRAGEAQAVRSASWFILTGLCFLAVLLAFAAPVCAEEPIRDVLKTYIKNHYPWEDVELGEVKLSSPAPAQLPSAISVIKAPPGKAVFRLVFPGNKRITATTSVKAFDRVLRSRSSLGKGYSLRQNDIYTTLMESSRIPQGALRDENRAINKTLTRSVVSNAVLTDAVVSETAIVKRGHQVVLCADKPGFTVKTLGEMKQDAAVGDMVKALNLFSKKVVTGQLIDENTVRVEF